MRDKVSIEAFLLHAKPSKSGLSLDLLTKEGIVRSYFYGNTKDRAKFTCFQILELTLDTSNYRLITSIEQVSCSRVILAGESLFCAMYVHELMLRLVINEDKNAYIFYIYRDVLNALSSNILDSKWVLEMVLRVFEIRLLQSLGLYPGLQEDYTGYPILYDRLYYFDGTRGLVLSLYNLGISGKCLIDIRNNNWNAAALFAAKQLMRAIVAFYSGNEPLHSRKLFYKQYETGISVKNI